ncbi:hypothetical protein Y032_1125g3642 [Ancylostoma ceylanicum]|uniref:Uncharacterized protein n=1 Tax=Ancylostoma ceylanicum TaxID=53326 RepID=A0A016W7B9_9BILA|nr:hypothetical protein Y032_1125g3642 [Ancylostoma ceylanicum]
MTVPPLRTLPCVYHEPAVMVPDVFTNVRRSHVLFNFSMCHPEAMVQSSVMEGRHNQYACRCVHFVSRTCDTDACMSKVPYCERRDRHDEKRSQRCKSITRYRKLKKSKNSPVIQGITVNRRRRYRLPHYIVLDRFQTKHLLSALIASSKITTI